MTAAPADSDVSPAPINPWTWNIGMTTKERSPGSSRTARAMLAVDAAR
jgi:hypothetical protein